jgi:hypothetical protein
MLFDSLIVSFALRHHCQFWGLKILWSLVLGIWCFDFAPPGLLRRQNVV